jgi:hypothetical protein
MQNPAEIVLSNVSASSGCWWHMSDHHEDEEEEGDEDRTIGTIQ